MSTFRAILVICAIPALGLVAYWTVIWDVLGRAGVLSPFWLTYYCEFNLINNPDFVAACDELRLINWIGIASVGSLAIGLIIPAVFWVAASVVSSNRFLMAKVFPPLTFVGIIFVAALYFVYAGILAAGTYYADSYWAGRVHVFVIGAMALLGVTVPLIMVYSAFRMFRPAAVSVIGSVASADNFPKLHRLIASVAERISARRPDNVVLGLDDRFFATSAKVKVTGHDRSLSGETLYISLPLLRVFSQGELSAVIGHELGHFSGRDTEYSLRFAPIYRGLAEAVSLVDSDDPKEPNLIGMPVKMILGSMLSAFSRNEARASRDRELVADKLGSQAASREDLAFALMKITIFAHFWENEERRIVDRLQRRRLAKNISVNFIESVRYDLDRSKIVPVLREALHERIVHPTDTHPPTGSRLEALGLIPGELLDQETINLRLSLRDAAVEHLDNVERVEEHLTDVKHAIYAALGVSIPEEQSDEDAVGGLLAGIVAHLVRADGIVDDDEILVAEDLAGRALASFDRAYFRECCRSTTELPDLDELLRLANNVLTDAGKATILGLLHNVAEADGTVPDTEADVLRRAGALFAVADCSSSPTMSGQPSSTNSGEVRN